MDMVRAFASSSIHTFHTSVSENIADWFRHFLVNHALSKRAVHQGILPFGRFSHQMRKAMAGMRGRNESGVATGQWHLPCGLLAEEAWQYIQQQLAQVSVPLMLGHVLGEVDPQRYFSKPQRIRFVTPQVPKPKRPLFLTPEPAHDPLQGLNRARLETRLHKALNKGTAYVHIFSSELVRLLPKLAQLENVDPDALAEAEADIRHVIGLAESAARIRERLTPVQLNAKARAAMRREDKRFKKTLRRDERMVRKDKRKLTRRLANEQAALQATKVVRIRPERKAEKLAIPLELAPAAIRISFIDAKRVVQEINGKVWFKLGIGEKRNGKKLKTSGACRKLNRRRTTNYLKRIVTHAERLREQDAVAELAMAA